MNMNVRKRDPLKNELAAILLAAGYSKRMNAFKPLLPLGNSTVIDNSINTFLNAGISNITVVLGYQANRLKPMLEQKNIKWVYNEKYDEGMYSSILAGVKSLPSITKGFFLLPADIPLVESHTINTLAKAYYQSKQSIIYPTFKSRKGHPPLISSCLFSEILDYDGAGGLKTLLRKHEEHSEYVEVDDEGILLDMDTYEEYLKIRDRLDNSLLKSNIL